MQPFPSQISYYRLHQVDYNGENHFSKTVAVKFEDDFEIVSAYADYENHSVKLFLNDAGNGIATYTLSDALGKIMVCATQQINNGVSVINIDMKKFSKGK